MPAFFRNFFFFLSLFLLLFFIFFLFFEIFYLFTLCCFLASLTISFFNAFTIDNKSFVLILFRLLFGFFNFSFSFSFSFRFVSFRLIPLFLFLFLSFFFYRFSKIFLRISPKDFKATAPESKQHSAVYARYLAMT